MGCVSPSKSNTEKALSTLQQFRWESWSVGRFSGGLELPGAIKWIFPEWQLSSEGTKLQLEDDPLTNEEIEACQTSCTYLMCLQVVVPEAWQNVFVDVQGG